MQHSKLRGPVSDEGIRRSAAGMIRAHGKDASGECETIIEKMALRRDPDGEHVWRRIRVAVLKTKGASG